LPIRILPNEVASAIAAGEVVARPASVVKELIENALDAGAGRIEISIERGGRELVEVADDGIGIPAAELPLAVARFATSKLRTTDDLHAISTLGFRGEALSSIGAVSRLELVTKVEGEPHGSRLVMEGGRISEPQPIGVPQGTVVRVRDLFFNVPARKEFLKSETTERRRISEQVTRYAIAYPEIRFRLTQRGRLTFQSSGNGDRREVLAAVFGVDAARQMISLPAAEGPQVKVEGFISPPSLHRGSRRGLTFFVNGRWVKDASLSAAVLQAYHGLLMVGRYPLAIILLNIPTEEVDVNVHPTKAEVRFRQPEVVFSITQRVIRATLLGQAPSPVVDFESRWSAGGRMGKPSVIDPDWALAHPTIEEGQPGSRQVLQPALPGGALPLLRAVGQVGAAYLVAEGPDGLYLIDQHAAHERVLFEALMAAHDQGAVESQALLEPITIEFTPAEASLLEQNLVVLERLGFDVEPFGKRAFRLRRLPVLLVRIAPEQALRAVVGDFEEDETPLSSELEARLAARVCKRASIKAGQVLSLAEQQQLLRDLERCKSPRTCPHGRPTMIHLSVDALERQFGRRG